MKVYVSFLGEGFYDYKTSKEFKSLYEDIDYYERTFITDNLMKVIGKLEENYYYFYVSTSKEDVLKRIKKDRIERL